MDTLNGFTPSKGQKIYFGRSHGEQTLGEVVKVNRSRVKVKQLESRGTFKSHPVGTVWTVPFTLCHPAPADVTPAPVAESPERSAMLAEIERLRRENSALKARQALPAFPATKRADSAILSDISTVYGQLSPENLTCDGELPRSQVQRKAASLNRRLRELFREIGRTVSEDEAWRAVSARGQS